MSLKSRDLLTLCDSFPPDRAELLVIDRKVALPRNKKGHPIRGLEEISFSEFQSDVKRVKRE